MRLQNSVESGGVAAKRMWMVCKTCRCCCTRPLNGKPSDCPLGGCQNSDLCLSPQSIYPGAR